MMFLNRFHKKKSLGMASLSFFEMQYIDYIIVRSTNALAFQMKQIATLYVKLTLLYRTQYFSTRTIVLVNK